MFNISNKHEEFFDYLIGNAEIFHKGALLAQGTMKDPTKLDAHLKEIHNLEHEADATNGEVIRNISGLIGAIIWNLLTWWFGMPLSSSHALMGGRIGAVVILPATMLHLPVSTTHVVSGSIFSVPFQRIVYNRAWKGWR